MVDDTTNDPTADEPQVTTDPEVDAYGDPKTLTSDPPPEGGGTGGGDSSDPTSDPPPDGGGTGGGL